MFLPTATDENPNQLEHQMLFLNNGPCSINIHTESPAQSWRETERKLSIRTESGHMAPLHHIG